ncbi:MAG: gluconolactonase [Gammaproteobacteria bacterium]|nr:MAG: gluconolactonase [Gammaproteobacteria bacterium]
MANDAFEVFVDGFTFLEGPRWRDGLLWVSDVNGKKVYTIAPDGTATTMAEVPDRPSGIGFLTDGTPVIVSMRDRCLKRIENGKLILHADISALVKGEINDMVVDKKGNAYVGSMGYDLFAGEDFKPGALVLVKANGEAQEVADGLHFPNGPVVTPDGKTLVVAESWGKRLTAFNIEDDGTLSGQRVFADLGDYTPDGITLDEEGGIWLAAFANDCFVRVKDGGEITDVIDLPGRRAVACTLGGEDMKTLYCMTFDGKMEDIGKGKKASRVETIRVKVAGAGSP